jgi:hypothetical protein
MDDEPAEAEAVSTMTDALDVSADSPSLITTVSGLTMTSSGKKATEEAIRRKGELGL